MPDPGFGSVRLTHPQSQLQAVIVQAVIVQTVIVQTVIVQTVIER